MCALRLVLRGSEPRADAYDRGGADSADGGRADGRGDPAVRCRQHHHAPSAAGWRPSPHRASWPHATHRAECGAVGDRSADRGPEPGTGSARPGHLDEHVRLHHELGRRAAAALLQPHQHQAQRDRRPGGAASPAATAGRPAVPGDTVGVAPALQGPARVGISRCAAAVRPRTGRRPGRRSRCRGLGSGAPRTGAWSARPRAARARRCRLRPPRSASPEPGHAPPHPERRPVDRLSGGAAQQHHATRSDQIELGEQPGCARDDVQSAGTLVDPLAAALTRPAEVLDHVGPVGVIRVDPGLHDGVDQQPPGRPDERPSFAVLTVAGLLPDEHQRCRGSPLTGHRLDRVDVQLAPHDIAAGPRAARPPSGHRAPRPAPQPAARVMSASFLLFRTRVPGDERGETAPRLPQRVQRADPADQTIERGWS